MKTCFHSQFYVNFPASVHLLFLFSDFRENFTKNLGMINSILGSFCSFFNWEGASIRPQIRPRKIPDLIAPNKHTVHTSFSNVFLDSVEPDQLIRIHTVFHTHNVNNEITLLD